MTKLGDQILTGLYELVNNIDEYIEHQRRLETNTPICPECGKHRVHLLLLRLNTPSLWMCQDCGHKFEGITNEGLTAEQGARP